MRMRSDRVSSRNRAARPEARASLSLAVGFGETTDDGDLLAVDDDLRVAGEPAVGQPAGEPVGGVARVGLVGLLPAAGAAGRSAVDVDVA